MSFVTNDIEDEASSSIALDFSHKIRQYYSGNSDECMIKQFLSHEQELDFNIEDTKECYSKI